MYDKCDDFDFEIVSFPYLDWDVPRRASYGVYISHLIWFASVSSHVTDLNIRNKVLTAKHLNQGYRYNKLRKAFSIFYRRHFSLTTVIKPLLPNFLGRAIVILNFVRRFQNFIADTVPC